MLMGNIVFGVVTTLKKMKSCQTWELRDTGLFVICKITSANLR